MQVISSALFSILDTKNNGLMNTVIIIVENIFICKM